MNILVINVSLRPESKLKLFPVGLGYITTAMKIAGFEFDLIDIDAHRYSESQVEQLIRKKPYQIVCMGCIVSGYKIIKNIVAKVREIYPKTIIVVGNSVASAVPEITLFKTAVDIAVIGEGDVTIVEVLKAVTAGRDLRDIAGICYRKDGELVRTESRPYIKNLDTLPFIDFSIWDTEIYIENTPESAKDSLPFPRKDARCLPINTARGCIAHCTFCYHEFKAIPYRFRSPESVVKEIVQLKKKYDLNLIGFSDELTFFSRKQSLALLDAFIEADLQVLWQCNCRADLFQKRDEELFEKFRKAGCLGMTYSLESADSGILQAMNKNISTVQFARQTRLLQNSGFATFTSLVFGYPQETRETIRKTIDCCIENNIYPSAGYLLPQPGSDMYDYAKDNGFITNEEDYLLSMGDRQDLLVNMTGMTNEEFEGYVRDGMRRCNEALNIGLSEEQLIKTQYYRASSKSG